MDQVAVTTPKRPKPRRKVKETPTAVSDPIVTPSKSGNAEASSSKTPAVVTVLPAPSVGDEPGPSIQSETTVSKRQLKKEKALREAEASGIPLSASKPKHKKKAEVVLPEKGGWQCVPLAQSEVFRVPPIWTRDGRHYITAQNTSIYIHSSLPPYNRQSTLSASGRKPHTAPITSLLLSPLNPKHIVTAAEDGYIKIWDIESGQIVYTIPAAGPIWQMCLAEVAGKWTGFITLTPGVQSKKKKPSTRIMHFLYPTIFPPSGCPIYQFGRLSAPSTALFVSPTSLYLVALAANKAYTFRLPSEPSSSAWKPQMVKFVTDQPLTCGSFAPTDKSGKGEDWFATGDLKGVIRLWHGLGQAFRLIGPKNNSNSNDEERRLPTTSLHWHAHAVASLAFTPSGSQLLSVGEESVLVQWHLGTGKREYVPRLGGRPIVSLAVKEALRGKEEEWWMAFEDGSVVKVGAGSGNVENVGQGVKIDPLRQITPSTPYPLALHPSTSALVLPSSNPGTLQFIQPGTSLHPTTLLFDLEVSPSNRVSRRDEKELQPVAIEMVAFSDMVSGVSEWMATVEGRSGDEWEGGGEVRTLKIWRWDGERYIVNTQFPRPHNLSPITSLAFSPLLAPTSPDRPYLLTTAIDGTAKLWHIRQSKKSEHGKAASKRPATFEYFWSPRSSWTYRSQPVHSASFSPDSTLIVLAHDSVLSLWDTESNVLLRALDAGSEVGQLSLTQFVGFEGRCLVAAGKAGMICWDLLSCAKIWSTPTAGIFALLPLPSGQFMTAQSISHQTVIDVYDPSQPPSPQTASGKQASHHTMSIKPIESTTVSQSLRSMLLISSPSRSASATYNLAGVSSSGDLFRITNGLTASGPPTRAAPLRVGSQAKEGPSIWQEMFGQHAFIDPSSASPETSSAPERKRQIVGRASAVFDGPSHTLPPPSLMFDGFMEEILASAAAPAQSLGAEGDGEEILYEQTEPMIQDVDQVKETEKAVKGVSNEDLKELEGFFTSILGLNSTSATPKEKKRPNGISKPNGSTKSKLNGGTSSGTEGETDADDEGIFDFPVQGPNPKVRGVGASPAKGKMNGLKAIEVGPEDEEDRSKKGKKRRAPKE